MRKDIDKGKPVKRCSILFINPDARKVSQAQALAKLGFVVEETGEWPELGRFLGSEVVVVIIAQMTGAAMLAARIRAQPRFGNRVLIGLAPLTASLIERRCAIGAGFDDVVGEDCDPRTLIARILRPLRARREHRCLLAIQAA